MSRLVGAAVCAASAAITAALAAAVTPLPLWVLLPAAIAGSALVWAVLDAAHDRQPPPEHPDGRSPWAGAHDFWLRLADRHEQRGDRKRAREFREYAKQAADRARNSTRTTT